MNRTLRSTWVVLPPAILMACVSQPAPDSAGVTSPVPAGYRAGGNEPFWDLTFGETTMEFSGLGRDTVSAARPEPETLDNGWRYATTTDGQPYTVRIDRQHCSDSMSGRPFPHTVTVTVGAETFAGCGGDTASLLTGDEWVVDELGGVDVAGGQAPTLNFASDGTLTGTGGCNRFRSSYEITGEGIRIAPAMATRMACTDPDANEREVRFFSLLERISRFDVPEDGALTLFEGDTPVIVAHR